MLASTTAEDQAKTTHSEESWTKFQWPGRTGSSREATKEPQAYSVQDQIRSTKEDSKPSTWFHFNWKEPEETTLGTRQTEESTREPETITLSQETTSSGSWTETSSYEGQGFRRTTEGPHTSWGNFQWPGRTAKFTPSSSPHPHIGKETRSNTWFRFSWSPSTKEGAEGATEGSKEDRITVNSNRQWSPLNWGKFLHSSTASVEKSEEKDVATGSSGWSKNQNEQSNNEPLTVNDGQSVGLDNTGNFGNEAVPQGNLELPEETRNIPKDSFGEKSYGPEEGAPLVDEDKNRLAEDDLQMTGEHLAEGNVDDQAHSDAGADLLGGMSHGQEENALPVGDNENHLAEEDALSINGADFAKENVEDHARPNAENDLLDETKHGQDENALLMGENRHQVAEGDALPMKGGGFAEEDVEDQTHPEAEDDFLRELSNRQEEGNAVLAEEGSNRLAEEDTMQAIQGNLAEENVEDQASLDAEADLLKEGDNLMKKSGEMLEGDFENSVIGLPPNLPITEKEGDSGRHYLGSEENAVPAEDMETNNNQGSELQAEEQKNFPEDQEQFQNHIEDASSLQGEDLSSDSFNQNPQQESLQEGGNADLQNFADENMEDQQMVVKNHQFSNGKELNYQDIGNPAIAEENKDNYYEDHNQEALNEQEIANNEGGGENQSNENIENLDNEEQDDQSMNEDQQYQDQEGQINNEFRGLPINDQAEGNPEPNGEERNFGDQQNYSLNEKSYEEQVGQNPQTLGGNLQEVDGSGPNLEGRFGENQAISNTREGVPNEQSQLEQGRDSVDEALDEGANHPIDLGENSQEMRAKLPNTDLPKLNGDLGEQQGIPNSEKDFPNEESQMEQAEMDEEDMANPPGFGQNRQAEENHQFPNTGLPNFDGTYEDQQQISNIGEDNNEYNTQDYLPSNEEVLYAQSPGKEELLYSVFDSENVFTSFEGIAKNENLDNIGGEKDILVPEINDNNNEVAVENTENVLDPNPNVSLPVLVSQKSDEEVLKDAESLVSLNEGQKMPQMTTNSEGTAVESTLESIKAFTLHKYDQNTEEEEEESSSRDQTESIKLLSKAGKLPLSTEETGSNREPSVAKTTPALNSEILRKTTQHTHTEGTEEGSNLPEHSLAMTRPPGRQHEYQNHHQMEQTKEAESSSPKALTGLLHVSLEKAPFTIPSGSHYDYFNAGTSITKAEEIITFAKVREKDFTSNVAEGQDIITNSEDMLVSKALEEGEMVLATDSSMYLNEEYEQIDFTSENHRSDGIIAISKLDYNTEEAENLEDLEEQTSSRPTSRTEIDDLHEDQSKKWPFDRKGPEEPSTPESVPDTNGGKELSHQTTLRHAKEEYTHEEATGDNKQKGGEGSTYKYLQRTESHEEEHAEQEVWNEGKEEEEAEKTGLQDKEENQGMGHLEALNSNTDSDQPEPESTGENEELKKAKSDDYEEKPASTEAESDTEPIVKQTEETYSPTALIGLQHVSLEEAPFTIPSDSHHEYFNSGTRSTKTEEAIPSVNVPEDQDITTNAEELLVSEMLEEVERVLATDFFGNSEDEHGQIGTTSESDTPKESVAITKLDYNTEEDEEPEELVEQTSKQASSNTEIVDLHEDQSKSWSFHRKEEPEEPYTTEEMSKTDGGTTGENKQEEEVGGSTNKEYRHEEGYTEQEVLEEGKEEEGAEGAGSQDKEENQGVEDLEAVNSNTGTGELEPESTVENEEQQKNEGLEGKPASTETESKTEEQMEENEKSETGQLETEGKKEKEKGEYESDEDHISEEPIAGSQFTASGEESEAETKEENVSEFADVTEESEVTGGPETTLAPEEQHTGNEDYDETPPEDQEYEESSEARKFEDEVAQHGLEAAEENNEATRPNEEEENEESKGTEVPEETEGSEQKGLKNEEGKEHTADKENMNGEENQTSQNEEETDMERGEENKAVNLGDEETKQRQEVTTKSSNFEQEEENQVSEEEKTIGGEEDAEQKGHQEIEQGKDNIPETEKPEEVEEKEDTAEPESHHANEEGNDNKQGAEKIEETKNVMNHEEENGKESNSQENYEALQPENTTNQEMENGAGNEATHSDKNQAEENGEGTGEQENVEENVTTGEENHYPIEGESEKTHVAESPEDTSSNKTTEETEQLEKTIEASHTPNVEGFEKEEQQKMTTVSENQQNVFSRGGDEMTKAEDNVAATEKQGKASKSEGEKSSKAFEKEKNEDEHLQKATTESGYSVGELSENEGRMAETKSHENEETARNEDAHNGSAILEESGTKFAEIREDLNEKQTQESITTSVHHITELYENEAEMKETKHQATIPTSREKEIKEEHLSTPIPEVGSTQTRIEKEGIGEGATDVTSQYLGVHKLNALEEVEELLPNFHSSLIHETSTLCVLCTEDVAEEAEQPVEESAEESMPKFSNKEEGTTLCAECEEEESKGRHDTAQLRKQKTHRVTAESSTGREGARTTGKEMEHGIHSAKSESSTRMGGTSNSAKKEENVENEQTYTELKNVTEMPQTEKVSSQTVTTNEESEPTSAPSSQSLKTKTWEELNEENREKLRSSTTYLEYLKSRTENGHNIDKGSEITEQAVHKEGEESSSVSGIGGFRLHSTTTQSVGEEEVSGTSEPEGHITKEEGSLEEERQEEKEFSELRHVTELSEENETATVNQVDQTQERTEEHHPNISSELAENYELERTTSFRSEEGTNTQSEEEGKSVTNKGATGVDEHAEQTEESVNQNTEIKSGKTSTSGQGSNNDTPTAENESTAAVVTNKESSEEQEEGKSSSSGPGDQEEVSETEGNHHQGTKSESSSSEQEQPEGLGTGDAEKETANTEEAANIEEQEESMRTEETERQSASANEKTTGESEIFQTGSENEETSSFGEKVEGEATMEEGKQNTISFGHTKSSEFTVWTEYFEERTSSSVETLGEASESEEGATITSEESSNLEENAEISEVESPGTKKGVLVTTSKEEMSTAEEAGEQAQTGREEEETVAPTEGTANGEETEHSLENEETSQAGGKEKDEEMNEGKQDNHETSGGKRKSTEHTTESEGIGVSEKEEELLTATPEKEENEEETSELVGSETEEGSLEDERRKELELSKLKQITESLDGTTSATNNEAIPTGEEMEGPEESEVKEQENEQSTEGTSIEQEEQEVSENEERIEQTTEEEESKPTRSTEHKSEEEETGATEEVKLSTETSVEEISEPEGSEAKEGSLEEEQEKGPEFSETEEITKPPGVTGASAHTHTKEVSTTEEAEEPEQEGTTSKEETNQTASAVSENDKTSSVGGNEQTNVETLEEQEGEKESTEPGAETEEFGISEEESTIETFSSTENPEETSVSEEMRHQETKNTGSLLEQQHEKSETEAGEVELKQGNKISSLSSSNPEEENTTSEASEQNEETKEHSEGAQSTKATKEEETNHSKIFRTGSENGLTTFLSENEQSEETPEEEEQKLTPMVHAKSTEAWTEAQEVVVSEEEELLPEPTSEREEEDNESSSPAETAEEETSNAKAEETEQTGPLEEEQLTSESTEEEERQTESSPSESTVTEEEEEEEGIEENSSSEEIATEEDSGETEEGGNTDASEAERVSTENAEEDQEEQSEISSSEEVFAEGTKEEYFTENLTGSSNEEHILTKTTGSSKTEENGKEATEEPTEGTKEENSAENSDEEETSTEPVESPSPEEVATHSTEEASTEETEEENSKGTASEEETSNNAKESSLSKEFVTETAEENLSEMEGKEESGTSEEEELLTKSTQGRENEGGSSGISTENSNESGENEGIGASEEEEEGVSAETTEIVKGHAESESSAGSEENEETRASEKEELSVETTEREENEGEAESSLPEEEVSEENNLTEHSTEMKESKEESLTETNGGEEHEEGQAESLSAPATSAEETEENISVEHSTAGEGTEETKEPEEEGHEEGQDRGSSSEETGTEEQEENTSAEATEEGEEHVASSESEQPGAENKEQFITEQPTEAEEIERASLKEIDLAELQGITESPNNQSGRTNKEQTTRSSSLQFGASKEEEEEPSAETTETEHIEGQAATERSTGSEESEGTVAPEEEELTAEATEGKENEGGTEGSLSEEMISEEDHLMEHSTEMKESKEESSTEPSGEEEHEEGKAKGLSTEGVTPEGTEENFLVEHSTEVEETENNASEEEGHEKEQGGSSSPEETGTEEHEENISAEATKGSEEVASSASEHPEAAENEEEIVANHSTEAGEFEESSLEKSELAELQKITEFASNQSERNNEEQTTRSGDLKIGASNKEEEPSAETKETEGIEGQAETEGSAESEESEGTGTSEEEELSAESTQRVGNGGEAESSLAEEMVSEGIHLTEHSTEMEGSKEETLAETSGGKEHEEGQAESMSTQGVSVEGTEENISNEYSTEAEGTKKTNASEEKGHEEEQGGSSSSEEIGREGQEENMSTEVAEGGEEQGTSTGSEHPEAENGKHIIAEQSTEAEEIESELAELQKITEFPSNQSEKTNEELTTRGSSRSSSSTLGFKFNTTAILFMTTVFANVATATSTTKRHHHVTTTRPPVYVDLPMFLPNETGSLHDHHGSEEAKHDHDHETLPPEVKGKAEDHNQCIIIYVNGPAILNGTKWVGPFREHFHQMQGGLEGSVEAEAETESIPGTTFHAISLERIDLPKFVKLNGCKKDDYESGKSCFCSIDSLVSSLKQEVSVDPHISHVECTNFLKVPKGVTFGNSSVPEVRKKRSLWFGRSSSPAKREVLDYSKGLFDEAFKIKNSDENIFALANTKAVIPCLNKNEVIEYNRYMKYSWSFEGEIDMPENQIQEEEGNLIIENVLPRDSGNYTCTVKSKLKDNPQEQGYHHRLLIVSTPIYRTKTTVMYFLNQTCDLTDGDIMATYLPKVLQGLLCGFQEKMCEVEVQRPRCINGPEEKLLNVTFITTMVTLSTLIPTIDNNVCNINCQMNIYSKLAGVLVKNIEMFERSPVHSQLQIKRLEFVPTEIIKDKAESTGRSSEPPVLIITCPPGFGVEKEHPRVCVVCPKQYFSKGEESYCRMCPAGQYQPMAGSQTCLVCSSPLENKACLRVLYSNTEYFKLYVGLAFGILILMIVIIVFCTHKKPSTEPKPKNRRNDFAFRHALRRNADVESGMDAENEPLLSGPEERPSGRLGPRLPPRDF